MLRLTRFAAPSFLTTSVVEEIVTLVVQVTTVGVISKAQAASRGEPWSGFSRDDSALILTRALWWLVAAMAVACERGTWKHAALERSDIQVVLRLNACTHVRA
jgi:hypothetical protein